MNRARPVQPQPPGRTTGRHVLDHQGATAPALRRLPCGHGHSQCAFEEHFRHPRHRHTLQLDIEAAPLASRSTARSQPAGGEGRGVLGGKSRCYGEATLRRREAVDSGSGPSCPHRCCMGWSILSLLRCSIRTTSELTTCGSGWLLDLKSGRMIIVLNSLKLRSGLNGAGKSIYTGSGCAQDIHA